MLLVAAAGITLAAFTDSGDVQTTYATGTLDLKFDDAQDGNPSPYLVDFSAGFDNMAPGDTVTREVLVYNSGTVDALVDMTAPQITNAAGSPASAVENALTLTISDTATSTVLYTGPLVAAELTGVDIDSGGSANGATLLFDVTLDAAATVDVAGQSISVVFPFTATQS
ncbi:TasA family protein [Microbacterium sp. Leaf161]|uniref:TasA family protein n=1 Tax=Microbacterium sp. Leaf161 TaxID=1736281 RepID=UPI00138EDD75|nr:TasA family protein [Microbacterium sp. Leaf161]